MILLLLLFQASILIHRNIKSADKTLNLLSDQIVDVLKRSENLESVLTESHKDDYIIRAKTVSYIIEHNASAETDVEELRKIASIMKVDEIHLFDETGTIYGGTIEKYYGMNMDSGDQIAYFKPMLDNRNLAMCQDMTPNTAESKTMMYALVWREDQKGMIQIGLKPSRLMNELSSYSVDEMISTMPVVDGVSIHIENVMTRDSYRTKSDQADTTDSYPVTIKAWSRPFSSFSGNTPIRCLFRAFGRYNIGITYDMTAVNKGIVPSLVVMFIYLLISAGIITYILHIRNMTEERFRIQEQLAQEENERQLNVLKSMAATYHSMHLIDISSNTFESITSRADIDMYITGNNNAEDTIRTVTFNLVSGAYRELMMEFTDFSTLKDRLKNKKSDYIEFINYDNKWFRAGIITIEADADGYPERVMYVTRLIDAEKRREEALIHRSNTDDLTGCYNRRAFEEDIEGYSIIGIPNNFALLSMDVNGLKQTNDTLGHAAGDELLIGASQCMDRVFSSFSKVYRTGGDEFMAILAISPDRIPELIDQFKDRTANWSGSVVKELSVSVGYICSDEANELSMSIADIERIVDQRMYKDKAIFYKEHGIDRRAQ